VGLKLVKLNRQLKQVGYVRGYHGQVRKEFKIPFPESLEAGWWADSARVEKPLIITWDERVTTLHTAWVEGYAHGWIAFLGPSFEYRLLANEVYIDSEVWTGPESCTTKRLESGSFYPINGENRFALEIKKALPTQPVGLSGIDLKVVCLFTGEQPMVKEKPPQWWKYVKWGLIGGGCLLAVYAGIELWKRARRS